MKILLFTEGPITLKEMKERIESSTEYSAKIINKANTIYGEKDCIEVEIENYEKLFDVTQCFNKEEKTYQIGIAKYKE